MRIAVNLLCAVRSPLADLPEHGKRPPWMSDEDYRDHLWTTRDGYTVPGLLHILVTDPVTESALALYHAGPNCLTPAGARRVAGQRLQEWAGWSAVVQAGDRPS